MNASVCPFCSRFPQVSERNGKTVVRCLSLGCPAQAGSSLEKWNHRFDEAKPRKENYKVIAVFGDDKVIKCNACGLKARKLNGESL